MAEITILPRREWTPEDDSKLTEFLKKRGFDTLKLRIEKMISEQNALLIKDKDLSRIPAMEILSTLLKVCENARN